MLNDQKTEIIYQKLSDSELAAISRREYKQEYRDFVDVLGGYLVCTTAAGQITHSNENFERAITFSKENLLGKSFYDLINPSHASKFFSAFEKAKRSSSEQAQKLEIKITANPLRAIDLAITLVPNGKSEVLIVGWDITEQKENERLGRLQLERVKTDSQKKAFRMLADIPDGIFLLDKEWRLLYVNREAERIARKKSTEIIGQHLWKLYPELIGTRIYSEYSLAMSSGKASRFEDFLPEFNAWFETNLYPSEDGLVVYFRDISERKKSQEELKRYAEELERSNSELEQFAYVATHDLQEPLRMISSFVALLSAENAGKLDASSQQYIQIAQESADRMRTLIRDLLEYSKVSSIKPVMQEVNCAEVVAIVLLNLKQSIDQQQAKILVKDLPVIRASGVQLVLLFQTLINNAIKFRSANTPEIVVASKADKEGIVISITDNGIGIAPNYLESIFKIFKRLHSRETYPGTGIGLAIAKKIVEKLGGRIWVTSEEGRGSCVSFFLPDKVFVK
ncbi:MAG: sensor signal transduction histidine kinase [Bacteriovoracaceae bacterium]|nr:sensor signal transduction histidine kinase [Bacteriovoracaceae bacterium]